MKTALTLIALALSGTLQAASFDCTKAGNRIEHMICDNQAVSDLDSEMATVYKKAIANGDADKIRAEQRAWLKSRVSVKSADELAMSYKQRLEQLEAAQIDVPAQAPVAVKVPKEVPKAVPTKTPTKGKGLAVDYSSQYVVIDKDGNHKIHQKGDGFSDDINNSDHWWQDHPDYEEEVFEHMFYTPVRILEEADAANPVAAAHQKRMLAEMEELDKQIAEAKKEGPKSAAPQKAERNPIVDAAALPTEVQQAYVDYVSTFVGIDTCHKLGYINANHPMVKAAVTEEISGYADIIGQVDQVLVDSMFPNIQRMVELNSKNNPKDFRDYCVETNHEMIEVTESVDEVVTTLAAAKLCEDGLYRHKEYIDKKINKRINLLKKKIGSSYSTEYMNDKYLEKVNEIVEEENLYLVCHELEKTIETELKRSKASNDKPF